ncbi:DUF2911 domain-containing protein [Rudanella paleaurantiibacter]|uniref:DUF2911 domain-containing protein n=1 Tax=Rudanella paleaurantiibacter TaxID=2614655 RepID=A0A7J5U4H3_9BACT|nr:DUF2911 domain-containing protein [Rudanella paleaurantiibacter]KAB7732742.1 DUF2911 domain-containing protein [Rudanella paleaurantiibacter]
MTKSLWTLALVASLAGSVQAQIRTPQASPMATVSQGIGLSKATVEYSRPALKGRKMFGDQVPYGKVWRTGANMATKLTLDAEMSVNGKAVPAGSYALFTIPGQNEWTIILNKNTKAFGAFDYKEAEDVLRFTVKPEKLSTPAEYFTVEFTDFTPTTANLAMRWENVQVKFPLKQDSDAQIMAQIDAEVSKPDAKPGVFSAAANYYFDTNRDLTKARAWADKVVEADKKYWTYFLRGKIAAKQGDCKTARADAEAGLKMAQEAGDDAYIKNHKGILATCK